MDIIHGLSNLEIETTPSSSQVEEVKRNWAELPTDVMSVILLKLGAVSILVSVQWVCTSWWKVSKQPHLFRSIYVEEVLTLFGRRSVTMYSSFKLSRGMAREAIDRSCGQLVEFSVRTIATDELLYHLSEKSSSLRCLRLVDDEDNVTDHGLIQIAKKLPQLEELEITQCSYFSKDAIVTFGRFCPRLKSCRLNNVNYDSTRTEFHGSVVLAIAENMPELRHLNLSGNNVTDDGLRAILDGCPHLQSIDLRDCLNLNFAGDLLERCRNIEVLRPLNYSTDDDFGYGGRGDYVYTTSDEDTDDGSLPPSFLTNFLNVCH